MPWRSAKFGTTVIFGCSPTRTSLHYGVGSSFVNNQLNYPLSDLSNSRLVTDTDRQRHKAIACTKEVEIVFLRFLIVVAFLTFLLFKNFSIIKMLNVDTSVTQNSILIILCIVCDVI